MQIVGISNRRHFESPAVGIVSSWNRRESQYHLEFRKVPEKSPTRCRAELFHFGVGPGLED